MTDFIAHSHDDYRNDLPEFALGILDGRQRAALLAHLDTCLECAQTVQELTDASDALLHVPVGAEPTLGFESRIIERIRRSQPTPNRRTLRSWPSLAAAAALVVVSFGLGWALEHGLSHSPTAKPVALGNMDQRSLELNGHNVGSVLAYPGSPSWMFVTVDAPPSLSSVRCTVVTKSGDRQFIGTFTLKNGEGSWGTSLPVDFTTVRNVQLTSSNGAVVANLAAATWSYPTSTH
jgi:hypothetical protein